MRFKKREDEVEIRIGILGYPNSGKTAFINRYMSSSFSDRKEKYSISCEKRVVYNDVLFKVIIYEVHDPELSLADPYSSQSTIKSIFDWASALLKDAKYVKKDAEYDGFIFLANPDNWESVDYLRENYQKRPDQQPIVWVLTHSDDGRQQTPMLEGISVTHTSAKTGEQVSLPFEKIMQHCLAEKAKEANKRDSLEELKQEEDKTSTNDLQPDNSLTQGNVAKPVAIFVGVSAVILILFVFHLVTPVFMMLCAFVLAHVVLSASVGGGSLLMGMTVLCGTMILDAHRAAIRSQSATDLEMRQINFQKNEPSSVQEERPPSTDLPPVEDLQFPPGFFSGGFGYVPPEYLESGGEPESNGLQGT